MTPGSGADPASLDRLHDIFVPAAAPVWPPAPGWIALAAMVFLLGIALAIRVRRLRQRNRYRIEALAELERLRSDAPGLAAAERAGALLVLLRRAALSAYPRRELASLSGPAWWRYLDERDREPRFAEGRGARLEALAYGAVAEPATEETLGDLAGAVEAWVRGHRSELAGAEAGADADVRAGADAEAR
jgi:hypothetical protein